jgi:hypothetical protein
MVKALDLWKEIWPTNLVDTTLEGSVVWLDKMPDNTDLKGKIVINLMPPTPITQSWVSLWQYRYTASAMGQQGRELLSHGVAAIILLLMIL